MSKDNRGLVTRSTLNTTVDRDLLKALDALRIAERRTKASLVDEALEDLFKKYKKK